MLESLEPRQMLAGMPELLFDLNKLEAANPRNFTEHNGRLFFVADHETFGAEVWTSDGSSAGTQLLADLNPGPAGSNVRGFVESGGLLYFVAETAAHGAELWRTDGNTLGTVLAADIAPGAASGFAPDAELVDVQGTLFFVADNGAGAMLWKLGGTPPMPVKDITPLSNPSGISELTAVGDRLYFVGDDGLNGAELWISDGTDVGTHLTQSLSSDPLTPGPSNLTNFNGSLFFNANSEFFGGSLYRTAGTTGEVFLVSLGGSPQQLTVAGGMLYFQASFSSTGTELWKSDGTGQGTAIVRDLEVGSDSSTPEDLTAMGNTLFFTTRRDGLHRLWRTDGSELGTIQLTSHPGDEPWERPANLTVLGNKLYFTMRRGEERTSLWRTDGTPAGTIEIVPDIIPEGSRISSTELAAAGGVLYFRRIFNQFDSGGQLWKFDPATSNATMVKFLPSDVTDSSFAHGFTPFGDRLLFIAQDGLGGEQLWSRQGTAAPVRLTRGLTGIANLTHVGNRVFFTVISATGQRQLWRTDGTASGTVEIPNVAFLFGNSEIGNLRDVNGKLFFTAYLSDSRMMLAGLAQTGSQFLFLHELSSGSRPPFEAVSAGGIYYVVGPGPLNEAWRSDGTVEGTYRLLDDAPGTFMFYPRNLVTRGNALYFLAYGANGVGLWKVVAPGAAPELLTAAFDLGAVETFEDLTVSGERVYFTVEMLGGDSQLWVSDGTSVGTGPVMTFFNVTMGFAEASQLTDVDGTLMFVVNSPQTGHALWKSDGTEIGTVQVADLTPTANEAPPSELTAVGDVLYFRPGGAGTLAESNGTAEGTFVQDWNSPEQISDLANVNGQLHFSGYSHAHGWEAWKYKIVEPTAIVGRRLFYNQSKYDGNSAVLNVSDDSAIATDKTPYLAGSGLATFGNISSYSRGINGVMIDIANLPPAPASTTPATLTLADFQFRVGQSNDLATWALAPAPNGMSTRSPVGDLSELARISFSWASNAIQNTWLEITVLANERTGLTEPSVFYFGNRIGDTGSGTLTVATTTAADELMARYSPGPNQSITSVLDFNRDWAVTAVDALIARTNHGGLRKLNLPGSSTLTPSAAPLSISAPLAVAPLAAALSQAPKPTQDGTLAAVTPPLSTEISRGELLALAMQSWNAWLDADDEADPLGQLSLIGKRRR